MEVQRGALRRETGYPPLKSPSGRRACQSAGQWWVPAGEELRVPQFTWAVTSCAGTSSLRVHGGPDGGYPEETRRNARRRNNNKPLSLSQCINESLRCKPSPTEGEGMTTCSLGSRIAHDEKGGWGGSQAGKEGPSNRKPGLKRKESRIRAFPSRRPRPLSSQGEFPEGTQANCTAPLCGPHQGKAGTRPAQLVGILQWSFLAPPPPCRETLVFSLSSDQQGGHHHNSMLVPCLLALSRRYAHFELLGASQ